MAVKFKTYVREWGADVRSRPAWFFSELYLLAAFSILVWLTFELTTLPDAIKELVELQWVLIRALKAHHPASVGGPERAPKPAWVAWYVPARRLKQRP